MISRSYLDPLGSQLPALERNILKVRAMQMVLVLFYAEQLKQRVVETIQGTESLMDRLKPGSAPLRVPKGAKNPVEKALSALVADGAITESDKIEIVKLIDFRNIIGHDIHELVADLSSDRYARQIAIFSADRIAQYDYHAVDRLRHFQSMFDRLYRTHHYVTVLRMDGLMFRSAEKTLLAEIDRLTRKVKRLHLERRGKLQALNAEMKRSAEMYEEEESDHPLNRYDNGRLTQRGAEVCYRLFDEDKSPMAVAHLMCISLVAASRRKKQWVALGGKRRSKADVRTLPKRKFYRRDDD